MKKLICVIITLSILLTSTAAIAAGKKLSCTIEEAINIALENSKQTDIDNLDIKINEIILNDSKYDLNPGSGNSLDNAYKTGVEPIIVETNLEMAKRNKENNEKSLKLDVYRAALDILLTEKELQSEKEKLAILKEKYEMARTRFQQSSITEIDVYNAEYAVGSKEIDISKVEDKYESAVYEFKKLLDLPLDETPVEIRDNIVMGEMDEIDIDEVVSNSLANNASVYKKSQNVKAEQKNLENTKHYFHQGDSTYDTAMYDLEIAKLDLEEAQANLETDIRNKYNDLLNSRDKAELAKAFAGLAEKKLQIARVKYDNGTISKEAYLSEEESYLNALYEKYVAIHDYNIIKAEFEEMLGEE